MTEPDYRCILVCRNCSSDGDTVMPFDNRIDRGRWASQHTKGTGHNNWYCLDGWPSPVEVAERMRESARLALQLRALFLEAIGEPDTE